MRKRKINKNIFVYFILMLAMISVFSVVILTMKIVELNSEVSMLESLNEEQKIYYERENGKLEETNIILAQKVLLEEEQNEIEEAKQNPIGIPVSGQAVIHNDPSGSEQEENTENSSVNSSNLPDKTGINPYTLEIEVEKGSKIIASGAGVISFIGKDDIYGNIVKINHGNGYVTVYRYDEQPKIKVGDEIHKGQMIFEVTKIKGVFAYHILFENRYINPFDLIEIVG